jgi:hypothetical protein
MLELKTDVTAKTDNAAAMQRWSPYEAYPARGRWREAVAVTSID